MLAYHWTSADKVFKLTNHLECDFFAHYVFPFETQRSATVSLKTIRQRISQKKKEWIKNHPELARKYMEPWVNSGTYGFGTYSTVSDGHLCYSSLELWVDEKLTEHNLRHIIHPHIPNSTKYADFLVNDVFIEVDGMRKETEEDWKGKLEVYRKNNLKFIIIKPKANVDKILEDIKNGRFNTKKDK